MYVYLKTEPQLFTAGFYNPQGKWISESDHGSKEEAAKRVAFLNGDIPEGMVLMPKALTAENGAKFIFIGEFSETSPEIDCEDCDGSGVISRGLEAEDCERCEGSGSYTNTVLVSWPTIKEIYALAVEKLGERI